MALYQSTFIKNDIYSKGNTFTIYSSNYFFFKKYLQAYAKEKILFLNTPLNEERRMNELLMKTSNEIQPGSILLCLAEPAESRKNCILSHYKYPFNRLIYLFHFIYHRVFPKLSGFTENIYSNINKRAGQVLHSSEILGRVASQGFSIVEYCFEKNMLLIAAKKITVKKSRQKVPRGLLFVMPRLGKDGRMIKVYKFRTMHPYAEHLQEFMLTKHGLDDDGKFKNDFRVAGWGRVLRKYWIDELPMIINLIKGDIKLVGVRPISSRYFELYPDDVKVLRLQTKPGFIPPSYADSAGSLQDIIRLEKKYLLAYQQQPFLTDAKYLFKIFVNFFRKKIRSK